MNRKGSRQARGPHQTRPRGQKLSQGPLCACPVDRKHRGTSTTVLAGPGLVTELAC